MNARDFERQYAERSGMSIRRLHKLGRYVFPCRCGDDICEGWQMVHLWSLDDFDMMHFSKLYRNKYNYLIKTTERKAA